MGNSSIFSILLSEFLFCVLLACDHGNFKLPNMVDCRPWLSCSDLVDVSVGELVGFGAVKKIYHSEWQNNEIALVFLNDKRYLKIFFQVWRTLNCSQLIGIG